MNTTIRGVDEAIFRKFKAKAAEEGMKIGEAVTQALESWVKEREHAKKRASLREIECYDWGKGTEKVSSQIDQILYGEKT